MRRDGRKERFCLYHGPAAAVGSACKPVECTLRQKCQTGHPKARKVTR